MTPWNDQQISRAVFREALFRRRGMSPDEAEQWVDKLAIRDLERDGRRTCDECAHLQQSGSCFAGLKPLRKILQRCHRFEWSRP